MENLNFENGHNALQLTNRESGPTSKKYCYIAISADAKSPHQLLFKIGDQRSWDSEYPSYRRTNPSCWFRSISIEWPEALRRNNAGNWLQRQLFPYPWQPVRKRFLREPLVGYERVDRTEWYRTTAEHTEVLRWLMAEWDAGTEPSYSYSSEATVVVMGIKDRVDLNARPDGRLINVRGTRRAKGCHPKVKIARGDSYGAAFANPVAALLFFLSILRS